MGDRTHVAVIREYLEVWRRDGLDAFLDLVPEDVEFVPYAGNGRALDGKAPLRDFWHEMAARGEELEVDVLDLEALDDDNVLVTGTLTRRGPDGSSTDRLAWLYSFRDGRLWRASGHASAAEAREVARFLHVERKEVSRGGPNFTATLHQERGGRSVLELAGELDLASAPGLADAIADASRSGHVLVDLSGLVFMDSSGLRVLLEAARDAQSDGWRLELRRGPETVQRVFTLSSTERLLSFVDEPAG